MANTTLQAIAPQVALSGGGETRISALGDGTAKPGDAVGLTSAGKVVQADLGASENFVGFLDIEITVDENTAIPDGDPCSIIVPKSGKAYAVHLEDPAATKIKGTPMGFSDTAGTLEFQAALNTAGVNSILDEDIASGDTYGKIRWL